MPFMTRNTGVYAAPDPTWLLTLAIAASLIAALLYGYLPGIVAEQAWLSTGTNEARLGGFFSEGEEEPFDFEAARRNHDLLYVVETDDEQRVRGAVNFAGAKKSQFRVLDDDPGGVVFRMRVPRRIDGRPAGYLYAGWSTATYRRALARGRRFAGPFSLSLCLLALGLVGAAWKARRTCMTVAELQETNGHLFNQSAELEQDLKAHRDAEEKLRQSEQRYRMLFENAMSSAYADLEKQKEQLEHEVNVRRETEDALRRSTRRLRAINDIRHLMLCLKPSSEIAHLAIKHLESLVPSTRAYVVEYDQVLGEGVVLAVSEREKTVLETGFRLPLSIFQSIGTLAARSLQYVENIEPRGDDSAIQSALTVKGVRSCILAPLVGHDEAAGLLFVGAEDPGAYSAEHCEIVRELAGLLAATIRQNRLTLDRERYETELILEKERAQEMARLKTSFLNNMTHEIRTPLTSIIGFAQILKEEAGPNQSEFTGLIEESAERLLDTINSVLDLARLESNRMTFQPELIDVRPEVERTARLLDTMAAKKGLTLRVEHHSRDARAHLDRAGLNRVVTNLVGNAIKFTRDGSVTVLTQTDEDGVYIQVRDTGIGISSEFIPKLFDEFHQESTGINRNHEGSGLGLAITKKLVHLMNGDISVDSEQGRGTTFTVRFPRVHTQEGPAKRYVGSSAKRILVLADKEDAIYLLEYILREKYAYEVVHSVPAALQLALGSSFDAVLVDVNLRDSAEISFLKQVRLIPRYRRTPILAMATQILPSDWKPYLDNGFDAIVHEPFVQKSLLSILEEKISETSSELA